MELSFSEELKSRMNPDKAIRRPYLGPEAVSFFSTLHDDLSGRRCGRIVGCHAFHLPQGLRTRLFAGIVQEFQPVVLPPLRCAAGQMRAARWRICASIQTALVT